MTEEIQNWLSQANEDLDGAQFNFTGGRYSIAAFMCQQAAEKALKAVLIKLTGNFPRIHDLTKLAKDAAAPAAVLECCAKITPAYTAARYPDIPTKYSREDCEKLLGDAEEVLKWARTNLS